LLLRSRGSFHRVARALLLHESEPYDELEGEELTTAIHSVEPTKTMGEPWLTRLRPSEAFGLLTGLGFGEVFHLTPKRAQQRYFAGRDDKLRAPRFEQLMTATI